LNTDDTDESNLVSDHDLAAGASRRLETIFLAIWRRAQNGEGGLDLTLAEAASLLGTSEESVRRRIKQGDIQARRDSRGRLRVVPITPAHQNLVSPEPSQTPPWVVDLWNTLRKMHAELEDAHSHAQQLGQELEATKTNLDHANRDLVSMRSNAPQTWNLGSNGSDDPAYRRGREKIESKILEARKIAGRRRWPWNLAAQR
jgi:hypothetical protein